jgi:hypothetical protein
MQTSIQADAVTAMPAVSSSAWQERFDLPPVAALPPRTRQQPSFIVIDLRRYRHHRGQLLLADRLCLGSVWTPFVRVRTRLPRASEGGTEI